MRTGRRRNSYTQKASDRAIIYAVAAIAKARGISRAQVALAWLRSNPVVVAPLVGATKPSHIDEAVASLAIELTGDEVTSLEASYSIFRSRPVSTDPTHKFIDNDTAR